MSMDVNSKEAELWSENMRLKSENEQLRSVLASCRSWIDAWTKHVGNCVGGNRCTCGRTAMLYEAAGALIDEG